MHGHKNWRCVCLLLALQRVLLKDNSLPLPLPLPLPYRFFIDEYKGGLLNADFSALALLASLPFALAFAFTLPLLITVLKRFFFICIVKTKPPCILN